MIKITYFNTLLSQLLQEVNVQLLENFQSTIAGFVLVANEKHLVRRLADNPGIWLAATIPSADPETVNEDNFAENNIVWLFVLEKTDPGNFTATEELEHYQKIQDVVTAVKNWLRHAKLSGNEHLEYLNLSSIHTDPEYQLGGWNGWSINFNFDTPGY
jgi:hypothetical protein